MRLLMFHISEFWYRPHRDQPLEHPESGTALPESILVWIQSEDHDVENRTAVLRKMVKNIRWLAKKVDCNHIILHSFAHLGDSKAEPAVANEIIEETASRLGEREYGVHIVPFGQFFEFKMHVNSPSIAKVFKQF